ncbi:MAG: substrate-binding domain-containing protein [Acidimicrobiaceae bacterium]|nr:substrate-binding domain-containing protein [Acidimicrobiaceae bacterium]
MARGTITGRRRRPRAARLAVAAAVVSASMLAAGCGSTAGSRAEDDGVVVMAASSLSDVLEAVFEGRESVTPVFAASSTLVAQLAAGAEADVLITADAATMDRAVAEGSVRGEPVLIATNNLVLATPAGNPGGVTGLADLSRRGLLVGLCAAEVPCGALAQRALGEAGVTPSADTLEPNVRALAAKISLGELDAGLVYATDARTAGLATVGAPELLDHRNGYHMAAIADEPAPEVQTVIDDFTDPGSSGAEALHAHGFGRP